MQRQFAGRGVRGEQTAKPQRESRKIGKSRQFQGNAREREKPANYFFAAILAQVSLSVTIRLKTGVPGVESFVSAQK